MNPYALGFLASVGAGTLVMLPLWAVIHNSLRKYALPRDSLSETVTWIPIAIGIVERIIFTTLIGWDVSGAAGFIGAWVTIKAAAGWAAWSKGTTYGRATIFVGLLLSGISVGFGILGGILIKTQTGISFFVGAPK